MATDKMLLLNLKAYPHGQLPSKFHPRFSVPTVMINRPSYCTTYKRQLILTCPSSSNVTRFVIANTVAASSEMLLSTAEQPIYEGGSGVLTPFHADQTTLDAGSSLLFVVENILNQAAHMADTALLGTQDYLEKLDEKVSKANFSPRLLCTIKQFFSMDKEIVLSELLVMAQKINVTLNLQEMQKVILCNKQIETHKEIVKSFTGMIFAKDNDLQPHTESDGSTNKMLSMATANDPLGDQVEHPNVFALSSTSDQNPAFRPQPRAAPLLAKVPAKSVYTFYYASMNVAWLDEFYKKATVVANDPFIKDSKSLTIKFCRIGDHWIEKQVQVLSKQKGWDKVCPKFLHNDQYSSHTGHFALLKNNSDVVLQGRGTKILKALGDFQEQWRKNLPSRNFEKSLVDHYNKLP
ncbi:uncharacterized protein LOC121242106 [Juglans microcarpa x Juglans regia]|uniref:uncharacterized protein LOC121242106 n=1 Tax=Juglans microcarpa x Juglans regia TaxID=2249226 RepID=UPI001B7EF599|nr:uncharacterized protein LOC121242106 [Juglans microcarpa x Juglans regia]